MGERERGSGSEGVGDAAGAEAAAEQRGRAAKTKIKDINYA